MPLSSPMSSTRHPLEATSPSPNRHASTEEGIESASPRTRKKTTNTERRDGMDLRKIQIGVGRGRRRRPFWLTLKRMNVLAIRRRLIVVRPEPQVSLISSQFKTNEICILETPNQSSTSMRRLPLRTPSRTSSLERHVSLPPVSPAASLNLPPPPGSPAASMNLSPPPDSPTSSGRRVPSPGPDPEPELDQYVTSKKTAPRKSGRNGVGHRILIDCINFC